MAGRRWTGPPGPATGASRAERLFACERTLGAAPAAEAGRVERCAQQRLACAGPLGLVPCRVQLLVGCEVVFVLGWAWIVWGWAPLIGPAL